MKCPWCHKQTRRQDTDSFGECGRLACRQSRARACHTFVPDPKRDFFVQRAEEYAKVDARIAATPFVPDPPSVGYWNARQRELASGR